MSGITYIPNDYLPEPLYKALTTDTYSKAGKYSISGLVQPPQMTQLISRHPDKIVRDPKDRLYSLIGSGVHAAIHEYTDHETHIAERQFTMELAGVLVSGRPDVFSIEGGKLSDYKMTSVWVAQFGAKKEWDAQLNCYVYLMRENGIKVEAAEIVTLYRDFSKIKSEMARRLQNGSHPLASIEVYPIELWEDFEVREYLESRIALHEAAAALPDEELPPCTPDEQWRRGDTWKIVKAGNKRATKVFDNEKDAVEALATYDKNYRIDFHPANPIRCAYYCDAAPFCPQYARERAALEGDEEPPGDAA